jgi:hypothetical protein
MIRRDAGRLVFGPEMACFLGPAHIGGHTSLIRQIAGFAGKLSAENDP